MKDEKFESYFFSNPNLIKSGSSQMFASIPEDKQYENIEASEEMDFNLDEFNQYRESMIK